MSMAVDWIVIGLIKGIFLISGILELQILKGEGPIFPEEPFPLYVEALPFFWAFAFLPAIYFWIFHSMNGQTIGKMIFQIRVVREDGTPIGYGRALFRFLAYFISILPFGAGFLWAFVDKKGQSLHDKLARTVVIKGGSSFAIP